MNKDVFKEAKTMMEIHVLSTKLKSQGEDTIEVNHLATARKKELIAQSCKSAGFEKLQRNYTSITDGKENPVSQFPLIVENLNGNVIEVRHDGTVFFK